MTYIISVKTTYQTSEDTWERVTIVRLANEGTTLKEIEDWVRLKEGDLNTIQLHLNENEK